MLQRVVDSVTSDEDDSDDEGPNFKQGRNSIDKSYPNHAWSFETYPRCLELCISKLAVPYILLSLSPNLTLNPAKS